MFWGLLYPDPDPLARGTDSDPDSDPDPEPALVPDPSIIKQNSKKNLDSFYFATSL
jgi:hypothetical protein